MINFFRKIRYKLANDNKTALPADRFLKYARYAIGEIILVVIGILIALQINNWNEERKLHRSEIVLFKKMISDLKVESSSIEIEIGVAKIHQESHYAIYNKIKGRINHYSGKLNNTLQWTLVHRFKIKDIYQENLNEITNENVRDLMREYINVENKAISAMDRYTLYKTEFVRPFLERNGLYNMDSIYLIDPYVFYPDKGVEIVNNDKLEEHFGTDEFNSILVESRLHISWVIGKLQILQDNNQNFILELDKEIKNDEGFY